MGEVLEAAMERVRSGHGADGEAIMLSSLHATGLRAGEGSAAYAHSLFELASVLIAAGDLPRAAEPLRRAVAIRCRGDHEAERARLTYAMNLGEILRRTGALDEAEQVLRASLAERG